MFRGYAYSVSDAQLYTRKTPTNDKIDNYFIAFIYFVHFLFAKAVHYPDHYD